MARPNPILFPRAIPTYYSSFGKFSHLWNDAANNPINTDCGMVLYKVWEQAITDLPNLVLVSGIASGNYLLRVATDSEVQTTKLIIVGE